MESILGPAIGGGIIAIALGAIKVAENLSKNGKRNGNGTKDDVKATRDILTNAVANTRVEHAAINNGITRLTEETKEQTGELKGMRDDLRELCMTFRNNIPR